MDEQTTPAPDTTPPADPPPGEETQEQPEGDRYDGGEIPPTDPEPDE